VTDGFKKVEPCSLSPGLRSLEVISPPYVPLDVSLTGLFSSSLVTVLYLFGPFARVSLPFLLICCECPLLNQ